MATITLIFDIQLYIFRGRLPYSKQAKGRLQKFICCGCCCPPFLAELSLSYNFPSLEQVVKKYVAGKDAGKKWISTGRHWGAMLRRKRLQLPLLRQALPSILRQCCIYVALQHFDWYQRQKELRDVFKEKPHFPVFSSSLETSLMLLLQVILEILVAQKTHAMLRKVCHTQVAALVAHCDRLSVRVILILQKFKILKNFAQ